MNFLTCHRKSYDTSCQWAKIITPGGTLRSRLFCRQSDPHALLAGLRSVEACCERLRGVVRSLAELPDPSPEFTVHRGDPAVVASIDQAVTSVLAAVDELAACALAIEETTNERLSSKGTEDHRWSAGFQEHYPELLEVEVPEHHEGSEGVDAEFDRVLTRCRLQVAAVKDRYSMFLPGLPWIGPDRDSFTGKRLTFVRVHLEAAADALDSAADHEARIDLTDDPTALLTG